MIPGCRSTAYSCRTVSARAALRCVGLARRAAGALAPLVIPDIALWHLPTIVRRRGGLRSGTDEPPGMGRVGDALVDSLRQQTDGLNIRAYA